MPDELVFYTNPMSRGRVVRWMLEEVGEPYKVEVLDYASTMKGRDYLAINPMGKVPALRHGNVVVTETARSAPISPMLFRKADSLPRRAIACVRPMTAGCSSPPDHSRPPQATGFSVLWSRPTVSV